MLRCHHDVLKFIIYRHVIILLIGLFQELLAMQKFLSWPIRIQLTVLVFLLGLTSTGIIVYSGIMQRNTIIRKTYEDCQELTNTIALEQENFVAAAQQLVITLSQLPEIRSRNVAVMNALLREIRQKNHQYANLVITDISGIAWAAALPLKGTVPLADRKSFRDAIRTGQFSSGDLIQGRITGKPLLSFGYPVKDKSGKIIAVILAGIDPEWNDQLFTMKNLPAGTSAAIIDHKGTILYLRLHSEKFIGKMDREDLFRRMKEGPEQGIFRGKDTDGLQRLFAYKKIRLANEQAPYLYIRTTMPQKSVTASANAAMFKNLAILTPILLLALSVVWIIGRRSIVDRIVALKDASQHLAQGNLGFRVFDKVAGGELGELGQAFDEMASALATRELARQRAVSALQESEERYRFLFREMLNGFALYEIILDTTGRPVNYRFLAVNPAFEAMTGLKAPDVIGRTVLDVLPDIEPEWIETCGKVALNGEPIHFGEYNRKLKRFYEITAYCPAPGQFACIMMDITERKLAKEALWESQHFVQHVLSSTPNLIYIYDLAEQRYVYINKGVALFLGVTPGQVPAMGSTLFQNILHPEDTHGVARHHARLAKAGDEVFEVEYRMKHASGEWHWLRSRDVVFSRDSAGVAREILGSAEDITIQKQAEARERQAHREREFLVARLQLQMDRMPIGFILADTDMRFIYLNPAAERIFGFPKEELLGKSLYELIIPKSGRRNFEDIRERLCAGDLSAHCTIGNITKDGRTIVCEWINTPLQNSDGTVVNIMAMVQNVTERIRVEEELRESEERFRQLFAQNEDAIVIFDYRNCAIVDLNRATEKLFGFSSEELLDSGISLLLKGSELHHFNKMIYGLNKDGGLQIDKMVMVRNDGTLLFTSIRGKLIKLLHREVVYCSFRDITEKIRLEEEATAAQAKLIQADKMSSLGLLVSGIAHEINNPNNFIMFNSTLLAEAWKSAMPILDEYYRENGDFTLGDLRFSESREIVPRLFAGLEDGSQRIMNIVDKLKNFARQDMGGAGAAVDVNKMISDAVTILDHEIKKCCEKFCLDLGHGLPAALGNAQQIEQVIINLVMNALQALPDKMHGISVVSALAEDGEHIVITVEDEGVGMSSDVLERLTEPFFTTKGDSGGTGLGLSISASILKNNKGTISFTSEPGRGTKAVVLLQTYPN